MASGAARRSEESFSPEDLRRKTVLGLIQAGRISHAVRMVASEKNLYSDPDLTLFTAAIVNRGHGPILIRHK